MKIENGSGALGDFQLSCSLLHLTTSVRIRLDKVEIHCLDLKRVSAKQIEEIGLASIEAPTVQERQLSYKTYSMAVAVHGSLVGSTPEDFLARFATGAPGQVGPLVGSGSVFYYGPAGEQVAASVTVDLSAILQPGLFVRTHVVWDAGKIVVTALSEFAAKHVQNVFSQLGIAVEKG
jgi:hypothetical protein